MSLTLDSLHIPRPRQTWDDVAGGFGPAAVTRVVARVVGVIALFVVAATVGLLLYGYAHSDRIYQGVSVAGVQVGGMTETEARTALEGAYGDYLGQPVVLTFEGAEYRVVPREAGLGLDVEATIGQAMAFGRSGSVWARTQSWARSLLRGSSLPAILSVDEARFDVSLKSIAPFVARPPVNAQIDVNSGSEPEIVSEVPGVAFDFGATSNLLLSQVSNRGSATLPIVAPVIAPDVRKEDLAPQLAEVQSAVASTLVISGVDQYWAVSQEDLKRIVSITAPGEPVQINRDALQALVRSIAKTIEHPAVNAVLLVTEQGELDVVPSDAAVDVNVNASVDAVISALQSGQHDVPLTIKREPAAISNEHAQSALARAEQLVGNGLTLTWKDGSAQLGRQDLIAALTIDPRPGEAEPIVIGFSPEIMALVLGPVAETIDITPQNGRYRYIDHKVKLVEKGANGQAVNIDKSTATVIDAVLGSKGSAKLTVEVKKPEFSSANASTIELNDVLATASTYYGNSSDARRNNVERAVELQSGWLVAPGDVFSYYEYIGKVDEKNGFVTGLGILSDGQGGITTAPVVGGGICQVSTTIFQSAFWAGLAIVDRTAHPYWLQSYGQPPSGMLGLDAMVDIVDDPSASLDLKFQNNTGDWIAVVMTADGVNVTSQIVGTNPGWTVKVEGDGPTISNPVDPPTDTTYQDSPEIPAGEERQVETAQQGFDATIHRITTDKDGNVIDEYVLTSTYVPSVNRVLRGTGTGA
jgi:vancomycin resistance protein YoaR